MLLLSLISRLSSHLRPAFAPPESPGQLCSCQRTRALYGMTKLPRVLLRTVLFGQVIEVAELFLSQEFALMKVNRFSCFVFLAERSYFNAKQFWLSFPGIPAT